MAVVHGQEYDAEVAIAEFLADAKQTTLELPHMTTGQRKHTKKVIEGYTELTCESYGFGQERKLHLFKKSSDVDKPDGFQVPVTSAVKVKNTFIDDWLSNQNDAGAKESFLFRSMPPMLSESVMFRSMPPMLSENVLTACIAEAENDGLSPVQETPASVEQRWDAVNGEISTAASSSGSAVGSPSGSARPPMFAKPPGLPTPTGNDIRNTFIHFQIPSAFADERAVQSMPHGMFSQYLLAEAIKEKAADKVHSSPALPPAPPPPAPPVEPAPALMPFSPSGAPSTCPSFAGTVEDLPLSTGADVVISGLQKCPAFNGFSGTVQSFDAETGRYDVLLSIPAGAHKWAKIKRDNLLLVSAVPPPQHFPTLAR